jgi:hypothetical protein
MKSPRRTTLASSVSSGAALSFASVALSILVVVLVVLGGLGCAGVKSAPPPNGSGGGSGQVTAPPIPGLRSIDVNPPSQTVLLNASGTTLSGSTTYTATGHFDDGHTEDVTSRVAWPSQFRSLIITRGMASVTAPGIYAVTAISGTVMGMGQLTATFQGDLLGNGFDPSGKATLDGTTSGSTQIAYPLDRAIFPPNLSPITVHVARTSGQSAARINFSVDPVVNVNYYAACQPGAGTGCYVDLPLSLTQLFVAVSDTKDVQMTARVGGLGAPLTESSPINVAWANVPLSGGLYYWTTLARDIVPGYVPPNNADNTPGTTGTGVLRYDFGKDGAALPQLVYTDRGRSPTFLGSPPATADGAQCVGCHAITTDGKTMALTIGGSATPDFALLDLTTLTMTVLNAAASTGVTSMSDINYYKQFRITQVATETTFGPNGDVMVNMFKSKLYLHGTTASLLNEGEVAPNYADAYKTDPFWSQSGKFFAFTSFAVPDAAPQYYNPTGLNGDMKRNGQISIASATATGINDDAHVLVPRENNITKYYPAISFDDALVVYNQSTCGIDPDVYTNLNSTPTVGVYGAQTCDGYDDSSATLWLTSPTGMRPQRLDNANGGPTYDNSWPRWSPDNGTFRGTKLYWLAFSSRRPYGLQVNNGVPLSTKPQLWFAAVLIGGETILDPSSPPVWLPNQNLTPASQLPNQTPTGNHVPQWVKVAVAIPG